MIWPSPRSGPISNISKSSLIVLGAYDWVQHGARYRGGGDVLKKNAREARIVTIPDISPTLGWGPSARFMPVNFV